MMSLILLLILGGVILWGLGHFLPRSVVWVFEPIIKYFQEKSEDDSGKVDVDISSLQENGTHKKEHIEVDLTKKKDKSDK